MLILRRLQRAHENGSWSDLERVRPVVPESHPRCFLPIHTFEWFREVQQHCSHLAPNSQRSVLSTVCAIVHQRPVDGLDVARAVRAVIDVRRMTCGPAFGQTVRRTYAVANWVWHDMLQMLPERLSCPKTQAPRQRIPRVLHPQDVESIHRAAEQHSPLAAILVRILFTTGLRISAVARLRWTDVRPISMVLEKGGRLRCLALTTDVRHALQRLPRNGRPHIFPGHGQSRGHCP